MAFARKTPEADAAGGARGWARAVPLAAGGLLRAAVLCAALLRSAVIPDRAAASELADDGLFRLTNMWSVRLRFTPEQWAAMEPKGGPGPFGGPGEPGRPPGPGVFLGSVLVRAFDANEDGVVTRAEFDAGFRRWFDSWNADHSGMLTEAQLRAGINRDLSPPWAGPPAGFGPLEEPDGF